ncbi:hypothetical protein H4582DRAFT_1172192 [Lactarius indigo]|nr:hypothetical protein H4582DRAFT_1172192 [Lactarius indigo]
MRQPPSVPYYNLCFEYAMEMEKKRKAEGNTPMTSTRRQKVSGVMAIPTEGISIRTNISLREKVSCLTSTLTSSLLLKKKRSLSRMDCATHKLRRGMLKWVRRRPMICPAQSRRQLPVLSPPSLSSHTCFCAPGPLRPSYSCSLRRFSSVSVVSHPVSFQYRRRHVITL